MDGFDDDEGNSSSSEEFDSDDVEEVDDALNGTCCGRGCLKAFQELPDDLQARVCEYYYSSRRRVFFIVA